MTAENGGIPYRPKSAMFIHGTADRFIVPYKSALRLFGKYAENLSCATHTDRTPVADSGRFKIDVESWTDCDCDTFVEFYHVIGKGHMMNFPAVFVERLLKQMLGVEKTSEECL